MRMFMYLFLIDSFPTRCLGFTLILDVNQPNLVQLRQHLAVDLKWGTRLAHEGACSGIQFFPPASLAGLSLEFEVHFDLQPFRLKCFVQHG